MSHKMFLSGALCGAILSVMAGCESFSTPDARQNAAPPTPPAAAADAPTPAAPPPMGGRGGGFARGGRGGPQIPQGIEATMSDMERTLNAIKAEAADATKIDQTLRDLATFERDVALCKTMNPPVNRVDAANRGEAPADYRAAMTGLMKTCLDLEDAVTAKKADDIKKLIAQLEEIQKNGHKEFKVGND